MEQALPSLVDYSFTAKMEDELDEIAVGKKDRLAMLQAFYNVGLMPTLEKAGEQVDPRQVCTIPIGEKDGVEVSVRVGRYGPFLASGESTAPITDAVAPDEVSLEWALEQLAKKAEGPRSLGSDAEGNAIFVMNGRFGPYVQRGEAKEKEKPPRASLLPGMDPSEVSLEAALQLLSFPKVLGKDGEGNEIVVSNGKFGPYVKKGTDSRSIPANVSLLDVTLPLALQLFSEPRKSPGRAAPSALRELGNTPAGAPIRLMSGRFGPYVTDGTTNATLPKGLAPENLTPEEAVELIEKRAAAGPSPKKGKKSAPDPMTSRVLSAEGKPKTSRAKAQKESSEAMMEALPAAAKPRVSKPKTEAKEASDAPKASKSRSKKAAKPEPPPKPVIPQMVTIKASKAGKEQAKEPAKEQAPLTALPPGIIRRK
jgi:DNA topoisomerase-1